MHVRISPTRAVLSLALAALTSAAVVVPASAASTGPGIAVAPDAVVTLGDSYASGLGAGNYYNDCDNSPDAWGNLIFPASVTSRTMLACSGATIPTVQGQVAQLAGIRRRATGSSPSRSVETRSGSATSCWTASSPTAPTTRPRSRLGSTACSAR